VIQKNKTKFLYWQRHGLLTIALMSCNPWMSVSQTPLKAPIVSLSKTVIAQYWLVPGVDLCMI